MRGWGGRKTKEEGREKTLLREKGEGETFPLRDSPVVFDQVLDQVLDHVLDHVVNFQILYHYTMYCCQSSDTIPLYHVLLSILLSYPGCWVHLQTRYKST